MNKLTNTTKHVLTQSPRFQADSIKGGNLFSEGTTNILARTPKFDNLIGFNRDNFNSMEGTTAI